MCHKKLTFLDIFLTRSRCIDAKFTKSEGYLTTKLLLDIVFCRVIIEHFSKNHDSEHGFEDQHEANGRKRCSVFVISIDPADFRVKNPKNHDFDHDFERYNGAICFSSRSLSSFFVCFRSKL